MSDQGKKPREFWLGLNEVVIYTKNDFVELPTKEDPGPFVHVIEHSAYEKLQKERDELKAWVDKIGQQAIKTVAKKNDIIDLAREMHHSTAESYHKKISECSALQAKLAEAQAALTWYAEADFKGEIWIDGKLKSDDFDLNDYARSALAKLRGQDGA